MSVFGGVTAVGTWLIMRFAQHHRSMDGTVSLITQTRYKCESVLSQDMLCKNADDDVGDVRVGHLGGG